MKKTKISEERKKRTKYLFILIIVAAVLAITTTYTWFTMRGDVELKSLKLNVEAASNMQLSLDGDVWAQSIEITDMNQLYGTVTDATYQAKQGEETNYVPKALSPVSTIGQLDGASHKLNFVYGTVDGQQLIDIKKCSEADLTKDTDVTTRQQKNENHPYLAFDMYIRNFSNDGDTELLQLSAGSKISIASDGVTGTGLEYSARVAFVSYSSTVTAESGGASARSLQPSAYDKVVIWEPNHKEHTQNVVTGNDRVNKPEEYVPTYPVDTNTVPSTYTSIDDINGTDSTDGLGTLDTFTTDYTTNDGVTTSTTMKDIQGTELEIAQNQITKIRVYIWLEGQDPDCVDLASTGKTLEATLKLNKVPKVLP